ncbi:DNA primase family protein [Rhodovulum marinum]|nr:phage/plasmid primase, P4 family [Rhodovulum marinum]
MDARDALARAFEEAEQFPPADSGGPGAIPPDPQEEPIESRCAALPLNDYGNGQRFLAHFGEDCLFVPRVGWHRWTGQVWRLDEDRIDVRALAHRIGERILAELPWIALEDWERSAIEAEERASEELEALYRKDDPTRADRRRIKELEELVKEGKEARKALGARKRSHRAHAKSSGNTAAINNMLTEASVSVAVPLNRLNADPLVVNTRSGLIRFRKAVDPHEAAWAKDGEEVPERWGFELLPHDREHLVSKMIAADYDPGAAAPTFERFLARIQPDPERRAFLKRWFGYTLTGLTTEQKLLFAHGGGRNGKSTLVDLIAEIMSDYATTVPIESLTGAEQRKGSDATPDLVRIPGARMVRASEPEQGQRMREAIVKALTGGEPVLIRRMQQEFVEVTPEFKLTISGNHKPEIRGDDDGIWRRVMLLPFDEQIPEEEVDPLLPRKLRAEASGVLNWMIEGAVEWLEGGLQVPAAISEATRVYREESDPLRVFLLTQCHVTGRDSDELLARDLVDGFRLWMEDTGNEPWGKRAVSMRLAKAAGMFKHPETGATFAARKKSDSYYVGIGFLPEIAARLALRRDRDAGYR